MCYDTHMEVRGQVVVSGFFFHFYWGTGIGFRSPDLHGRATCSTIPPSEMLTFLFRALHLRILAWKGVGAWSLHQVLKEVMGTK